MGFYIKKTGGPHHGHEIFDIGGITDLNEEKVFVAFLLKSKLKDTYERDKLFTQFYDCTEREALDVISIVCPTNLDNKTEYRTFRLLKLLNSNKKYCLILREEMTRILYSFKKEHSSI